MGGRLNRTRRDPLMRIASTSLPIYSQRSARGFSSERPEGGFFKGVLSQKVAHWDEMHQLAPAMPGQRWARSEIGTASPASNVATQARSLPG
jgi:hypothetical protein